MAVQCVAGTAGQLINAVNPALSLTQSTTAGASAKFSIQVWINANWGSTSTATGRTSMVGLYGPSPSPTTAIQIGSSTGAGEISCWTWGGGVLVNTPNGFMTPLNNTWVHVAYTYDATTHRIYMNGNLIASSTTAQLAGNLQMVCINGFPGGGAGETFNHTVDAYSLYNRVLSASEILTIYNSQGSRHGIDIGAIATYEFDELAEGVSTTTVLDLSGNAINLVMTGTGTSPKYTYTTTYAGSNLRPVITT